MLSVYYKTGEVRHWEVNQDKEHTTYISSTAHYVADVEADGEELNFILQNFRNIPLVFNKLNIMRWFGDHAKFIVWNLFRLTNKE